MLDFVCLLFSLYLQYRPVQTDAPATGAANIVGLKFSCLFERAEIQILVNKFECPQRLRFSPGNREVHPPITTPEIISVMALTLQPIRGSPQHSGETGTRLSSAIHRRLLSRFFLREGRRLYTGYYTDFCRFRLYKYQTLSLISVLLLCTWPVWWNFRHLIFRKDIILTQ